MRPLTTILLLLLVTTPAAFGQALVPDEPTLRELFNHHADPTSEITAANAGQMQHA